MSKYCTSCGKENSESANYCSNCGKSLESRGSSSSASSCPSYSSYDATDGYVYDFGGHLRPDPDRLREDKKRSDEAFRNRM